MFLCSIIQTPLLGRQRGSSTSNSQAVQIQQDTDIAVFFLLSFTCLFVFSRVCVEADQSVTTVAGLLRLCHLLSPFFFSLFRKREQTTLAVSFQQNKGGKKQGQPASTQLNSQKKGTSLTPHKKTKLRCTNNSPHYGGLRGWVMSIYMPASRYRDSCRQKKKKEHSAASCLKKKKREKKKDTSVSQKQKNFIKEGRKKKRCHATCKTAILGNHEQQQQLLKAVRGKLRQHLKKVAEHTKTVRRWEARKKKRERGEKSTVQHNKQGDKKEIKIPVKQRKEKIIGGESLYPNSSQKIHIQKIPFRKVARRKEKQQRRKCETKKK